MGLKQILPIAAGAAILAASGGLAAPAVAAAEGAGAAGAAGAGAGGLLGAASGMTGTALGSGAGLLAPSVGESVLANSGEFANLGAGAASDTLASQAVNAVPTSAMDTLNGAAGLQDTTNLIPVRDLANSSIGMTPMSSWDNMKNFADKYGTVNNLSGAANLGMKYADMNKPRPMQSSGQVTRGQAPTMEALMALQKMGYQLPQNKKINFSLLG